MSVEISSQICQGDSRRAVLLPPPPAAAFFLLFRPVGNMQACVPPFFCNLERQIVQAKQMGTHGCGGREGRMLPFPLPSHPRSPPPLSGVRKAVGGLFEPVRTKVHIHTHSATTWSAVLVPFYIAKKGATWILLLSGDRSQQQTQATYLHDGFCE